MKIKQDFSEKDKQKMKETANKIIDLIGYNHKTINEKFTVLIFLVSSFEELTGKKLLKKDLS